MAIPPPIAIDILSMPDTFVIMIVALVVFGPRRLPQIGRQIGKLMYEFRKASNDFKFQMEEELRNAEEADRRKKEEEERKRVLAAAPPAPQLEAPAAQATEPVTAATDSGPAALESPAPERPAPYPAASIAGESPDPDRPFYPDVIAEETRPPLPEINPEAGPETAPAASNSAEAAALPVAEPASEPATPRIKPPSTGETVAAERPGAQSLQRGLFDAAPDESCEAPESVTPETERSETAAHHG